LQGELEEEDLVCYFFWGFLKTLSKKEKRQRKRKARRDEVNTTLHSLFPNIVEYLEGFMSFRIQ